MQLKQGSIAVQTEYVSPPAPEMTLGEAKRCRLNRLSCVYFIWESDRIIYVGKTVAFHARHRNHHKNYADEHMISWVAFPEDEVAHAENFYKFLLRPRDNYETIESSRRKRRSL